MASGLVEIGMAESDKLIEARRPAANSKLSSGKPHEASDKATNGKAAIDDKRQGGRRQPASGKADIGKAENGNADNSKVARSNAASCKVAIGNSTWL